MSDSLPDRLVRFVTDVALTLHFVAAAGWWWLSPKGFPMERSQFWVNSVLPVAAMAVAVGAIAALCVDRRQVAAAGVLVFAAAWGAAAVVGRVVFPVSLAGVWVLFLLAALAGGALFVLLVRGGRKLVMAWAGCAAVGAAIGSGVVWAEIPRSAATLPLDQRPPLVDGTERADAEASLEIGPNGQFDTRRAALTLASGNMRLSCSPLVEFHRVSADGFWSILAPRNSGTRRRPTGQIVGSESRLVEYDDGATVVLPTSASPEAVELTAYTPLQQDTYAHLNSYCVLEITGHKELSLTFSPCPTARIDVLPADYPFGRPARMAYLDAAGEFHVVEATSGEKGPFHPLASGPLRRGEPLTITIYDDGRPVWSITFDDWSAQASTDLSPSAGWGLSMGAIEFQRQGDAPSEPATIWITLAATSVGRGFETVGHRAGVYRNRVVIQSGLE